MEGPRERQARTKVRIARRTGILLSHRTCVMSGPLAIMQILKPIDYACNRTTIDFQRLIDHRLSWDVSEGEANAVAWHDVALQSAEPVTGEHFETNFDGRYVNTEQKLQRSGTTIVVDDRAWGARIRRSCSEHAQGRCLRKVQN